ncbi:hypothetical protein EDC96DRAFT_491733 [Choanephora cucurbitarum]|nr:hypothetical protein EDC96DRAFT_491733 [Choanephora cucurbitarum]
MNHNQLPTEDPLIKKVKMDDDDNDSGDDSDVKPSRRSGRRKIKIEYIEDKNRRHITFSKRKAGIMKKAYELSTLTGTQVLLLVVSETGLVYTFTTVKLQPIVTKPEGKNLIQACLNAPDPMSNEQADNESTYNPGNNTGGSSRADVDKKPVYEDSKLETVPQASAPPPPPPSQSTPNAYNNPGPAGNSASPYQPPYGSGSAPSSMPPMVPNTYNGHPSYMSHPYHSQQQQQQQQQQQSQPPSNQPNHSPQQQPYGQLPAPAFYGNQQQPPYMSHQQQAPPPQQHHGYWSNNSASPIMRQPQEDEKVRRGLPPKN